MASAHVHRPIQILLQRRGISLMECARRRCEVGNPALAALRRIDEVMDRLKVAESLPRHGRMSLGILMRATAEEVRAVSTLITAIAAIAASAAPALRAVRVDPLIALRSE